MTIPGNLRLMWLYASSRRALRNPILSLGLSASWPGKLATGYRFGMTIHRIRYSSPPVPANRNSNSQSSRMVVTFHP